MTYEEIVAALRRGNCDSTADALERAVEDEARALRDERRPLGVAAEIQASRAAARDYYAEDITAQLRDPVQPNPNRMLNLRRFPVTWAVAEIMRQEGIAPPRLVGPGEASRNWK